MQTLNAGIDWFTATSKDDRIGMNWYEMYVRHREKFGREGTVFEENWSNGFYSGLRSAGLKWGYSDSHGYILIASGQTAMDKWRDMRPARHRITRLDLCVDIFLAEPSSLAKDNYEKLLEDGAGQAKKFHYITNSDGGDTLYIGSRQSTQYGRLYDKGVEARREQAGHLWRYEVEYKKPVSGFLAENLIREPSGILPAAIVARVAQWYTDHNVFIPVSMEGLGTQVPIFVEEHITTATRRLAWLRGQVAPTVTRLIEAGLGKEVLYNLLLDTRTIKRILEDESEDRPDGG